MSQPVAHPREPARRQPHQRVPMRHGQHLALLRARPTARQHRRHAPRLRRQRHRVLQRPQLGHHGQSAATRPTGRVPREPDALMLRAPKRHLCAKALARVHQVAPRRQHAHAPRPTRRFVVAQQRYRHVGAPPRPAHIPGQGRLHLGLDRQLEFRWHGIHPVHVRRAL